MRSNGDEFRMKQGWVFSQSMTSNLQPSAASITSSLEIRKGSPAQRRAASPALPVPLEGGHGLVRDPQVPLQRRSIEAEGAGIEGQFVLRAVLLRSGVWIGIFSTGKLEGMEKVPRSGTGRPPLSSGGTP